MSLRGLMAMIACTPVGCAPLLDDVRLTRYGDPHAGRQVDSYRCYQSGERWWCQRASGSEPVRFEAHLERRAPLPDAEAKRLLDALDAVGARSLRDDVAAAPHAIHNVVELRAGDEVHRFSFGLGPELPPAPRPVDRAAAAIVKATEASGATSIPTGSP